MMPSFPLGLPHNQQQHAAISTRPVPFIHQHFHPYRQRFPAQETGPVRSPHPSGFSPGPFPKSLNSCLQSLSQNSNSNANSFHAPTPNFHITNPQGPPYPPNQQATSHRIPNTHTHQPLHTQITPANRHQQNIIEMVQQRILDTQTGRGPFQPHIPSHFPSQTMEPFHSHSQSSTLSAQPSPTTSPPVPGHPPPEGARGWVLPPPIPPSDRPHSATRDTPANEFQDQSHNSQNPIGVHASPGANQPPVNHMPKPINSPVIGSFLPHTVQHFVPPGVEHRPLNNSMSPPQSRFTSSSIHSPTAHIQFLPGGQLAPNFLGGADKTTSNAFQNRADNRCLNGRVQSHPPAECVLAINHATSAAPASVTSCSTVNHDMGSTGPCASEYFSCARRSDPQTSESSNPVPVNTNPGSSIFREKRTPPQKLKLLPSTDNVQQQQSGNESDEKTSVHGTEKFTRTARPSSSNVQNLETQQRPHTETASVVSTSSTSRITNAVNATSSNTKSPRSVSSETKNSHQMHEQRGAVLIACSKGGSDHMETMRDGVSSADECEAEDISRHGAPIPPLIKHLVQKHEQPSLGRACKLAKVRRTRDVEHGNRIRDLSFALEECEFQHDLMLHAYRVQEAALEKISAVRREMEDGTMPV